MDRQHKTQTHHLTDTATAQVKAVKATMAGAACGKTQPRRDECLMLFFSEHAGATTANPISYQTNMQLCPAGDGIQ